ncbi:MAG: hypothetical protein OEM49_04010 [Myxococcales bacterium]|nr:hypothetical protein [Myxococcales bacterium]
MPCPKIEGCPLYPELKLELSLKIWRTHYCDTDEDYRRCARYKLSQSGEMPHPRLMPDGDFPGESKQWPPRTGTLLNR